MGSTPSVISVGSFDGVHLGHRALLERARSGSARVVVMTFDPHPLSVLRPEKTPARLTTFEQRRDLLQRAGADEVVRLEPSPELLGLEPEAFVESHLLPYNPVAVVEGPDFRFGRARRGDVELLRRLGEAHGFEVQIPELVEGTLEDASICPVSSSTIRWLLERGRVRDAARLLGRPYALEGTVIRGDRRGREIGFPTANLQTACLMPADGVYAGVAGLDDGRSLVAAISVGTKPTFDGVGRVVEAFLLDASRDGDRIEGLGEYGWSIELTFVSWIREQVRFASLEGLLDQMQRDCATVRERVEAGCAKGETAQCL